MIVLLKPFTSKRFRRINFCCEKKMAMIENVDDHYYINTQPVFLFVLNNKPITFLIVI